MRPFARTRWRLLAAVASLAIPAVPIRARADETDAADPADDDGGRLEVSVRGVRPLPGTPPKAPHVAGGVVPRERLAVPGVDAAEVLREAPGIQVVRLGGYGAPATAAVRGATAAQTPIYFAGVRINDEVGGAANLSDLPLFFTDHVEIYRSHAPLVASELGVGGALFFEPRRPDRDELGVGATVGSYGARGARAWASFAKTGRGVLAGFDLGAADNDYSFFNGRGTLFDPGDDRSSRLQNADAHTRNLWLVGREPMGRAWLTLMYNHGAREQGAPKLSLVPSERARVDYQRDLVALRSVVPVAAWRGDVETLSTAIGATTRIDDPLGELGLAADRTETPGRRVEHAVTARQHIASGVGLVERVGTVIDRLERIEQTNAQERVRVRARRLSTRLALGTEVALPRGLAANALLEGTCVDTADDDRLAPCRALVPAGRVGLSQGDRDHEVYANAGYYQRLPTLAELYGASLLVRGNPTLNVERGTAAEIGGRYALSSNGRRVAWLDAAAFARFSRDLVTYVRTAQGFLHPLNRDRSRTLGGELAAGASPWSPLELGASLSALDPRDTSPGRLTRNDILPFLSRLTGAALARFRSRVLSEWLCEWSTAAKYLFQSSRFADPAGLGVIPAQGTVDLEASALLFRRELTLGARVANLFDQRRFDVVGFPLPGRSFFFSMEATW